MNESEALIVVERGPVPTTQVPLLTEQLTAGRSSGNDLILADPEVSRRHIRILRRADGFAVEDTGSTNGTFVNGQRISHLTLLQDGDTIDLGDTVRLRFVSVRQDTPVTSVGDPVDTAYNPTQAFAAVAIPTEEPAAAKPLPPRQPPAPARPKQVPNVEPVPYFNPPPSYAAEAPRGRRGLWVGCGLLAALLLVCAGTFLVLDAYDQGRLLYCGPLASIFEIILGPFGFAPVCP